MSERGTPTTWPARRRTVTSVSPDGNAASDPTTGVEQYWIKVVLLANEKFPRALNVHAVDDEVCVSNRHAKSLMMSSICGVLEKSGGSRAGTPPGGMEL